MRRLAVATVAFLTAAALPATAQAALPRCPRLNYRQFSCLTSSKKPTASSTPFRRVGFLAASTGSTARSAPRTTSTVHSETAPNCANCVAITYDDGPSPSPTSSSTP